MTDKDYIKYLETIIKDKLLPVYKKVTREELYIHFRENIKVPAILRKKGK